MFVQMHHLEDLIIGVIKTRKHITIKYAHFCFLYKIKSITYIEARSSKRNWNKLKRMKLGNMSLRHKDKNVIRTRWVFGNNLNEDKEVTWNKARFVSKGHAKLEVKDIEEKFAPFAQSEVIMMFIAFASFKKFKGYQMDIISLSK